MFLSTRLPDSSEATSDPGADGQGSVREACKVPPIRKTSMAVVTGAGVSKVLRSLMDGGCAECVEYSDNDGWKLLGDAVRLLRDHDAGASGFEPLLVPDFTEDELHEVGIGTHNWPKTFGDSPTGVSGSGTMIEATGIVDPDDRKCLDLKLSTKLPCHLAMVCVIEFLPTGKALIGEEFVGFESQMMQGRQTLRGAIPVSQLLSEQARGHVPDAIWVIPIDPRNLRTFRWFQRPDFVRLLKEPRICSNDELVSEIFKILDTGFNRVAASATAPEPLESVVVKSVCVTESATCGSFANDSLATITLDAVQHSPEDGCPAVASSISLSVGKPIRKKGEVWFDGEIRRQATSPFSRLEVNRIGKTEPKPLFYVRPKSGCMNGSDVLRFVDALHRGRNIDRAIVFKALEQAILSAVKKHYGDEFAITVSIDQVSGQPSVLCGGQEIEPDILGEILGRISLQTAKQALLQRLRQTERDSIFDDYEVYTGRLVSGTVTRIEGDSALVKIGKNGFAKSTNASRYLFNESAVYRPACDDYGGLGDVVDHSEFDQLENIVIGREPLMIPTATLRKHFENPLHMQLDGIFANRNASSLQDEPSSQVVYLEGIGQGKTFLFETVVRSLLPKCEAALRWQIRPLEAAVAWAVNAANEAGKHAQCQIRDHISEIQEIWKASSASVWLIDEYDDRNRFITPFVARNYRRSVTVFDRGFPVLGGDECGFIPLVAHSGRGIAISDVETSRHKHYYKHGISATVGEIAVPLMYASLNVSVDEPHADGVLDLQFRRSFKVKKTSELTPGQLLQRDSLRLLPDLTVLDCLRRRNVAWCPWHPAKHGWDFRQSLETLCHKVCDTIIPDGVTLTIWYADWVRDRLFVYATDGYDFEYRDRKELALSDSVTGRVARDGTRMEIIDHPGLEFREREKAQAMGVYRAFIAPIPTPAQKPDPKRPSLGTINVYFYGDGQEREDVQASMKSVETWLPMFAQFVGQLARAFDEQRRRIALNVMAQKLDEQPVNQHSTMTHFDVLREFLRTVFGERVKVSLWARWQDRLYCVGTDGLYRPNPQRGPTELQGIRGHKGQKRRKHRQEPFVGDELGPYYYDFNEKIHQGMTTRLGRWEQSSDNKSPSSLRLLIDAKGHGKKSVRSSHWLREHFGIEGNYARWFLGVTVKDSQKQKSVGVIRLVRPASCKPFTRCDEELLKALATSAAWLFEGWTLEMREFLDRESRTVAHEGCARNRAAANRSRALSKFDSINEPNYTTKSRFVPLLAAKATAIVSPKSE